MSDRDQEKKPLSLNRSKLELSKTVEAGQVRQNFSHGRSKSVTVEVRKKRTFEKNESGRFREVKKDLVEEQSPAAEKPAPEAKKEPVEEPKPRPAVDDHGNLTDSERAARMAALKAAEERRKQDEADAEIRAREEAARKAEEEARKAEEAKAAAEAKQEEAPAASENDSPSVEEVEQRLAASTAKGKTSKPKPAAKPKAEETVIQGEPAEPLVPEERRRSAPADGKSKSRKEIDEENARVAARKRAEEEAGRAARTKGDEGRRRGKLSINNAMSGDEGGRRRSMASIKRQQAKAKARAQGPQKPKEKVVRDVVIPDVITVQELANRMAERAADVIKTLMSLGVMATINQSLDPDTAQLVVEEFGHNVKRVSDADVEESLVSVDDNDAKLVGRPPVVTVMGHVDHGKTSLLDYIRSSRVASGEAGGITQHIGAYHVETDHGMVSFLDTPGHAAFTSMRARGAQSTDVVILVVAADDGVMPQTEEAVQHAKAAGVPIVVAINKMDKESADPERVKSELAGRDVLPEDWGGTVPFIPVSAHTGMGIDELLEAVLLQAEILELKAHFTGPGQGVVVESRLDKGRGPVATLLVQNGMLKKGDIVLAGTCYGRARALLDENGEQTAEAGPSIPVEILGLNGTPDAGDNFMVVESEKKAREVAEFRESRMKEIVQQRQQAAKLDALFSGMGADKVENLNVVLKADVRGSLEALISSLQKLGTSEVKVNVVSSGVGGITETDVTLAVASSAVVFGFNVRADNAAKRIVENSGIDMRYYSVIYDLLDDVKQAMAGLLAPELREEITGIAEVRDVFNSPKFGQIAGCMVTDGTIYRNKKIRVLRDNVVVYEGELESLRRYKDDVQEVRNGMECGIGVKNYQDVRPGDQIEVFDVREIARTL
jgi:translation initiation factor IF-2